MPPESNEVIQLIVANTILFILVAIFMTSFLFIYRKRQSRHLKEKQSLETKFQQELLRTQLEIQEQTFKTISQEIHDNIGQMLSLAKLNLNTVDLQNEQKAAQKIGDAKKLVGKAIHDLRDLSKTLNTETITATGLLNAIEAELHLLQKTGTLQTAFHVSGPPEKFDPQKELILFRIVQEALHNIIKHAQAAHVSLSAVFEHGQLKLLIADDGCGFEGQGTASGSGLRNMQSRSKLIGADWQVESRKEEGTTVRITLPITN